MAFETGYRKALAAFGKLDHALGVALPGDAGDGGNRGDGGAASGPPESVQALAAGKPAPGAAWVLGKVALSSSSPVRQAGSGALLAVGLACGAHGPCVGVGPRSQALDHFAEAVAERGERVLDGDRDGRERVPPH
jgi:hypothetical protein